MPDLVQHPAARPPMPAVAAILSHYSRDKLASFIEVAISLLDTLDGEPDIELSGDEQDVGWPERPGMGNPPFTAPVDSEDCEPEGDEQDIAWTEWHNRGPQRQRMATYEVVGAPAAEEDDEDDDPDTSAEDAPEGFDPEQDRCAAGDDGVFSGAVSLHDVMKPDTGPGDSVDEERQQMADDVPCIPVFTLDYNIFNDQRQLLGYTLPRPMGDGTMEPEL